MSTTISCCCSAFHTERLANPVTEAMQERERAVARLTPEELQTMLDLNRKMLGRPTSAEAKAEADRLQRGQRSST